MSVSLTSPAPTIPEFRWLHSAKQDLKLGLSKEDRRVGCAFSKAHRKSGPIPSRFFRRRRPPIFAPHTGARRIAAQGTGDGRASRNPGAERNTRCVNDQWIVDVASIVRCTLSRSKTDSLLSCASSHSPSQDRQTKYSMLRPERRSERHKSAPIWLQWGQRSNR